MKALIVDDERVPAKLLNELIEQHCFEIKSVELFYNPIEALDRIKETHFDLLFLDIEMPNINGLELVKKANISHKTQVVYTTAYSSYAVDAFQLDAIHYLVKPIEVDQLIKAVRKVQAQLIQYQETDRSESKSISVYHKNEYIILPCQDILRLEGDSGCTKIKTIDNREYITTKRLGYYDRKLSNPHFIRCHKSHIVNRNYVARISKGKNGYLILKNEEIIPFSQSNKEQLESLIDS